VHVRLPETMLAAIDAKSTEEGTGRSEAIRRLVELGLNVKTPEPPVNKLARASRARELAAETIDQMIDPSVPPEERAQRRSRLTKGPEEFREVSVDRPKARR
jgi:hypothetical protein